MTAEELKAIAERCERDDEKWGGVGLSYPDVFQMMGDRRHLLTEVERLRAQWVSVEERLPETDEAVLIALPYAIIGRPCTTGQYVNHTWYCDDFGGHADVTHWMPLPTPPAVQP